MIHRRAPTCSAAHLCPSPSSTRPFVSDSATPPQDFNSALRSESRCLLIPNPPLQALQPGALNLHHNARVSECAAWHAMQADLLPQSMLRGETRLQERGKLERHCGGL